VFAGVVAESAAMFELPARRSAVRATLGKPAMTCGPAAVRTVELGYTDDGITTSAPGSAT